MQYKGEGGEGGREGECKRGWAGYAGKKTAHLIIHISADFKQLKEEEEEEYRVTYPVLMYHQKPVEVILLILSKHEDGNGKH